MSNPIRIPSLPIGQKHSERLHVRNTPFLYICETKQVFQSDPRKRMFETNQDPSYVVNYKVKPRIQANLWLPVFPTCSKLITQKKFKFSRKCIQTCAPHFPSINRRIAHLSSLDAVSVFSSPTLTQESHESSFSPFFNHLAKQLLLSNLTGISR